MPLPLSVSLPLVFGISGLTTAALLYWDHQPEKAQWAARKVFNFCRRVVGWAGMMCVIPGLFVLSIVPAMFFVTVRAVQCKPAKVNIKLT